jgi:hypothetical protein
MKDGLLPKGNENLAMTLLLNAWFHCRQPKRTNALMTKFNTIAADQNSLIITAVHQVFSGLHTTRSKYSSPNPLSVVDTQTPATISHDYSAPTGRLPIAFTFGAVTMITMRKRSTSDNVLAQLVPGTEKRIRK